MTVRRKEWVKEEASHGNSYENDHITSINEKSIKLKNQKYKCYQIFSPYSIICCRNLDGDGLQLNDTQRSRLSKELKGLKIEITHAQIARKYRVCNLTRRSAQMQCFPLQLENGQGGCNFIEIILNDIIWKFKLGNYLIIYWKTQYVLILPIIYESAIYILFSSVYLKVSK